MTDEEIRQFIYAQSKNLDGQIWLEIFKKIEEKLYNIKDIEKERWQSRYEAAKIIFDELIKPLELGSNQHKAENNKQYK